MYYRILYECCGYVYAREKRCNHKISYNLMAIVKLHIICDFYFIPLLNCISSGNLYEYYRGKYVLVDERTRTSKPNFRKEKLGHCCFCFFFFFNKLVLTIVLHSYKH